MTRSPPEDRVIPADHLPEGIEAVHAIGEPDQEERRQVCPRCGHEIVEFDDDVPEDLVGFWPHGGNFSLAFYETRAGRATYLTDANPTCGE